MKHFWLVCFLFFTACQPSPRNTEFKKPLFNMDFRLVVGAPLSPHQKQEVDQLIQVVFKEVDEVYNNWNPRSELSCLNQLPAGQRWMLSAVLAHLLEQAHALHELSGGRFDPTIEPLAKLWKTYLSAGSIPPQEKVLAIMPAIGWSHIHLENGVFWKDHSLTALDLGGIAKGYAVDRLAERLLSAGYPNIYIEWGGEVRTCGLHPEGRPWHVGIRGMGSVTLENEGLATSGDYYQCWEIEGTTYFHIIDPLTKKPLTRHPKTIATASVKASTCALADGLATCLMLFSSSEEASAWASQLENVNCWIGTRYYSRY